MLPNASAMVNDFVTDRATGGGFKLSSLRKACKVPAFVIKPGYIVYYVCLQWCLEAGPQPREDSSEEEHLLSENSYYTWPIACLPD